MTGSDFEIPFHRLPERFAESVSHPPSTPVTARPAATVVLLRQAPRGFDVLLLRRSGEAGFVPGAYVFPGGRVDPEDRDAALAGRLDGVTPEHAARRLGMSEDAPGAVAHYVAALREAFEETGILVARDAQGDPPPAAAEDGRVDALRRDLLEGRRGLAEVLDTLECRLDGTGVAYMAHWITPESEPRRYDTRFFVARVPAGVRTKVDSREMTDSVWLAPSEALRRSRRGTLPMVFPTIRTLERLAAFDTVERALSELRRLDVPTHRPELVVTPTGVAIRMPGGADPRRNP